MQTCLYTTTRRWLRATASLAALLTLAALPAAAESSAGGPTGAQIHTAVAHAERSRNLWATVNVCDTPKHPSEIGIRGQMPALGFPARLYMRIEVQYLSLPDLHFRPVPGASAWIGLGVQSGGVHQGGVVFRISPHAGLLRGSVRLQWKLGRKVIGQVTRATVHGHPSADFGDPPHHSLGTCLIS